MQKDKHTVYKVTAGEKEYFFEVDQVTPSSVSSCVRKIVKKHSLQDFDISWEEVKDCFSIRPYYDKLCGWVFDEPDRDLYKEALTGGTDKILDTVIDLLGYPEKKLDIVFSENKIGSKDLILTHTDDLGHGMGDEYVLKSEELNIEMTGWLCPVLIDYFGYAPKQIHINFLEITSKIPRSSH